MDLLAGDWDLSLPVMGARICLLMRPSPPSSMSSQHAVRLPLPGGATRPSSVARAKRPRTRRLFARFSLSLTTQPSRESSTGSSGYARSVVPGLTAQRRLHRPRVVPPRLQRGDELGQKLLPFALPRLKLLDTSENLSLEHGHIQVRPQGILGRPHPELRSAEVTRRSCTTLCGSHRLHLHCRHRWQSRVGGGRAWSARSCGPLGKGRD